MEPRQPKPKEDETISQFIVANVEFGAERIQIKDAWGLQTPKLYDVFHQAGNL